jgi:histidinol dehydrogenase
MEGELRSAVGGALEREVPVRDICFSGNGEPTLSPDFPEALERASRVRADLVPSANLVLISNGSFLLDEKLFSLLADAVFAHKLDIWLKLDAGTPGWFEKINRSDISFFKLTEKIKEFAARAPVTIQTMLCAIDGSCPPPEDETAWEKLILEIVACANVTGATGVCNASIGKVQIYGKARPSPEDPKAEALPTEYLEKRAESLRRALASSVKKPLTQIPSVEVYP